MSNQRYGPPSHKTQASTGISQTDQLSQRIDKLESLVREHLDEKNQWNSLVRSWVGKEVQIALLLPDTFVIGVLRWVDRYTMCIDERSGRPVIVHKGAVAMIRPMFDVTAKT